MAGEEGENLPMAGFYLSHSLGRNGGNFASRVRFLSPQEETLDDAHLLQSIVDWQPDFIGATLYLWNIERSLHLLKRVRRALPRVRIIAGGPEVAHPHPFLFKSRVPDVVVAGEGEAVFSSIMEALKRNARTNLRRVAWKTDRGYEWGDKPTPLLSLHDAMPPPSHQAWEPDAGGVAYIETVRGCPMRCSYCRYSQMRPKISFIGPEEVQKRIQVLVERGARSVRFVDPTFNANPTFKAILQSLRRFNRNRGVEFFGEIQADSLGPEEIALLAEAGFKEVEVGVQSLAQEVLSSIHRPLNRSPLEENIRLMGQAGITVTVDLMYGLPGQRLGDVLGSMAWANRFEGADVQCLQTLLLPGTELRTNRRRWKMKADRRPPYGVRSTATLSSEEIQVIEEEINRRWATDCMTERFVGHTLPDLFKEQVKVRPEAPEAMKTLPGASSRRALIFEGPALYLQTDKILALVRRAMRSEPHMMWQFVLNPEGEEPLNLMEEMIDAIRAFPPLWIDRFSSVAAWERVASRRIFVLLKRGRSYSRSWIEAAEALLEDAFY